MTDNYAVQDALIDTVREDLPQGWFDRFYFNLHDTARAPYVLMGAGVYPGTRVIDGYVMVVTDDRQRNIRFSDLYDGPAIPTTVGPFSWQTVEPDRTWRMTMGPNPFGVEFDLTWQARAPRWMCDPIEIEDRRGGLKSRFAHFFQSGRFEGWLRVEGKETDVSGWIGQRDRSTGTRPVSPGQGAHMWVQAQFPDYVIGFIQDVSRENAQILLDGAVMHEDGTVDRIEVSDHAISFDDRLELAPGHFRIRTESGRTYHLQVDPTPCGGGYLSGGGYGGHHGRVQGKDFLSVVDWPLPSEQFNCRTLDVPLTDRLVAYSCREGEGETIPGAGIFEFAHSRSPSYAYKPAV